LLLGHRSRIEDEEAGNDDGSAFLFSAPAALADGAAVIPEITAAAAYIAGADSEYWHGALERTCLVGIWRVAFDS